ncbi:hypothetical protein TWF694_006881 [Orbilia ellipsospora]|uniref:Uncharacterized protein n=1 Tax=Orbilia ellipsospora TaxID=2528407 RepID=A0AAV9XT82_9PEZI
MVYTRIAAILTFLAVYLFASVSSYIYVDGIAQNPVIISTTDDSNDAIGEELLINAYNSTLWINTPITTECGMFYQKLCPPANFTAMYINSDGTVALTSMVPGGQQLYIDPLSSALAYLTIRTAGPPVGAITKGFKIGENRVKRQVLINDSGQWVACGLGQTNSPYMIFLQQYGKTLDPKYLPNGNANNCNVIQIATMPVADRAYAWAYS